MKQQLLLIEDSPTQLITIKKRLENSGYEVLSAGTVAEALVLAYDEHPDLIISDIVMSQINGYQLCRLVKSDPELSSIPVILLTKLDGSVDRFWGMKSGADRFIPKEPGFPSLLTACQEILEDASRDENMQVSPHSVRHSKKKPSAEDINSRLNQLLERLLFEATITDEVRKLIDQSLDIDSIVERLFDLMSSVLNYDACAIAVNEIKETNVFLDCGGNITEEAMAGYLDRLCHQAGLPPNNLDLERTEFAPKNAMSQPIDLQGSRLGLLVLVPHAKETFQPGDMKVTRIICDQLSIVLRLYFNYKYQTDSEPKQKPAAL